MLMFNVYFQILILQGISCISQAAISIAKDIGCELFIAVNSRGEAEQINAYNGLNIIDMSTKDIETHVLKQTRRSGVDFVFNSRDHNVSAIGNLVRNKFNRCLIQAFKHCLSKSGRFLEADEADLFKIANSSCIHQLVQDGIDRSVVKPMKRIVFGFDQVKEVLKYVK